MDWGIILLGLTISTIFILKKALALREKKSTDQTSSSDSTNLNPEASSRDATNSQSQPLVHYAEPRIQQADFPGLESTNHWTATIPRTFRQPPARHENRRESNMVEAWKRAIIGLVRLSDQNIRLAKQQLAVNETQTAVQTAATSVENMTRALIHCYGGKPDDDTGQAEPLKLISTRFEGKDREEFEKAIHDVAKLDARAKTDLQNKHCNEEEALEIVDSAREIVNLFKRILTNRFAAEIPELDEAYPECDVLGVRF